MRLRTALLVVSALTIAVSCTADTAETESSAPSRASTTVGSETTGGSTTVGSLGLTFRLPPSFVAAEDPELVYLARSTTPRAIFSVAADKPAIVNYEAVGAESVKQVRLTGGIEAVAVQGKSFAGLPPGVIANELLVANGNRSFTVIFSAGQHDLEALWTDFMASVRVQPADK